MRLTTIACATVMAASLPTAAHADTVCEWMRFAEGVLETAGVPVDGPRTGEQSYAQSQAAFAMLEALNAIDRRYQSTLKLALAERGASQDAAAATAAYRVLITHFPNQKAQLDDSYRIAMFDVTDAVAREAGRRIGELAAAGALKRGGIDPAITQISYRPRTSPGVWTATALPAVQPFMVAFRPWSLKSVDAVRPAPPPALDSEIWRRDFDEVKRLGAKDSSERTPEQTVIARFRLAPDLTPTILTIAHQPGRTLVQNARLFALMSMATDDASIAIADAKLHYNFWRPITAIRNADMDGNDATAPDPNWEPLLGTPNHPEYPCGHCIHAASVATVLQAEAGAVPPGGVRFNTRRAPAITQTVPNLDAFIDTVSTARIYGGVHYRFSNDAAIEMGKKVANMTIAAHFRPLR